jgi:hypothetical protein
LRNVVCLTADQVLDLHAEALALGGGEGLRSVHLLHSAIAQPEQTAFGKDAYATIPEKAAAYGFFLAKNHLPVLTWVASIAVVAPGSGRGNPIDDVSEAHADYDQEEEMVDRDRGRDDAWNRRSLCDCIHSGATF